ncbi:hypothetical protein [Nostoc sp.]|uniref:hypothetical protein n=1 Tax=Nostoc sp. TaxID=1180 RepID=UPI002FF4CB82
MAISNDVQIEPGSEYVSMQVPVEMPEAVKFGKASAVYKISLLMPSTPASAEAPDFL